MPEELACQIEPLKKAIEAMGWPMIIQPEVEADDVIGTLAKQANDENISVTISTGDKDLAQLVNDKTKLINTMTNEILDVVGVEKKFGVGPDLIIDYLAIIGDKADNIPGVEKVGPKTALKWLNEHGTLNEIINNANSFNGVVGDNLRSALKWLPTAYNLITIKCDVNIKYSWDDFQKKPQDKELLKAIYQKYNFSSWLKDLDTNLDSLASPSNKEQKESDEFTFVNTKDYELVNTKDKLLKWVKDIEKHKFVAVDTETNSLDTMKAELVGISLCISPGCACYIPIKHQNASEEQLKLDDVLATLKPLLEDTSIKKVGQNIKYDSHIFLNYNISLKGITDDTMLMSYVLESNQNHGMNKLSSKYLNHNCISYESLVGKGVNQLTFDQVTLEDAVIYAAEDADITMQLYKVMCQKLIKDKSLNKIYQTIEIPAMEALIQIERNGVLVESKILGRQSNELGEQLLLLEKKAFELAGQPFNLSSPKQLQEILFEKLGINPIKKTPSGTPSTSEEVLTELAQDYPLPKIILEYRSLAKLKSTYTDKLPRMINNNTKRVHTSYNQAVAITGRLASSDPNLQNIPIKTPEGRKIREAFVAPKDHKILSADYSQIELRIMAHLSKDEGLIDAFKKNKDVHTITASEIFNCEIPLVTAEQRRYAKVINFGLIYGMGVYGLAKNLNIERKAAQNYIERYFSKYPSVRQYMEHTKETARRNGFIETFFGRKLWVPDINGSNGMRRAAAERAAINGPMQGTAADLIKMAMIEVAGWIKKEGTLKGRMIMQVHDELVFEVPNEEIEIFNVNVKKIMENIASLDIPLIVEIGSGINWEQAH
jgi:DNA polymerase-1